MKKNIFILVAFAILSVSCGKKETAELTTASGLLASRFETTLDGGQTTHLYTIKNANGMEVCVTNIGGRIVSVWVPDKSGNFRDVVLGFDNIQPYIPIKTNFGAIIGRYGNRIAGGKMTLSNRATYRLKQNDGKNTLHGGVRGFHTRYFDIEQPDSATLICQYLSKNNEEGFPGDMLVTVTYSLSNDNALHINYEAEANQSTVVNLTNHSYFNLSGDPNSTILDHLLFVDADSYTPTNDELIPTGVIAKVKGTPMDFTAPKAVGTHINDTTFEAVKFGNGYDHNYVLNKPGDMNRLAAKLVSPVTGIALEVYTTEPGLQVYTGNFLDGTDTGKKGIAYNYRTAICLETQHFPNSPNIPSFPTTELFPDSIYQTQTTYKFKNLKN
ncbi:MAG: galactose mutarotase [Dysgonamonadaceae bacterium]|jgi:aldose 1-epimerase|nr:galactose mutarotase [Dysgonamonadaceae bacterium]